MAKRKGQQQEAFEAGGRNVLPGQAWLEALARGIGRELSGADMGSPAGQKVREELGSLGYEQALREAYPEDFAMGRASNSDFVDPMTLLAMRGTPLREGARRLAGPGVTPRLGSGRIVEGEVMQAPAQIEGPLYDLSKRNAPISPQTSQFERNAVAAMQNGRRGFGYGYEAPSYFEEGGQGLKPSIDDFVPVQVRKNVQEFYDPTAMEQMAAEMRAGNRNAYRHPLYGPNADRPNYGQGSEGKGYFGNLPNPGVRSDIRGEIGTGAGMPRLRYEPVGQGGLPAVRGSGEVAYGSNLPMMARGQGAPSEMYGEFVEVPGLGFVPRGQGAGPQGAWNGSIDFGVSRGPMGGGAEGGMGLGRVAAGAGALGFGAGMGYGQREGNALNGPVDPYFGHGYGGTMGIGDVRFDGLNQMPVAELPLEQPIVAPSRQKAQKVMQKSGGKKQSASPAAPKPVAQQEFEPNFNYLVTKALDNLLGTNEAERGRKTQQDIEAYQKKYGPIYY